mgnify:CR=1 FL=1
MANLFVRPHGPAAHPLERRFAPRSCVAIPARMRQSGWPGFEVEIVNLSSSGFCAIAVTGMPEGTRAWIQMPGLASQECRIVWNDGATVGAEFATPLAESIEAWLIDRFPSPVE